LSLTLTILSQSFKRLLISDVVSSSYWTLAATVFGCYKVVTDERHI